MRVREVFVSAVFFISILIILPSCSNGKSPIEPQIENQQDITEFLPESSLNLDNVRTPLAVYDAVINPESGTFTITPIQRTAGYHLPLTNLYPNVLEITRYGFSPNFWADIKITHPLPNSGIDGFDPRVIAILPANPGVSMNYPTLDVIANNSVVLNHDGYTKLYDDLGGSIPGNTNPFLAYFKHVEYRRWFSSGTGLTSDTRRWDMDVNGFGGPMQFKLVVDVSVNHPDPPQYVIDNAPEPVQIEASIGTGLTSDGGSALVEVTLLDWQGSSDTICKVEAPDLFMDSVELSYSHPDPNPNEYVFSGTISNSFPAPNGNYKVLIAAMDINSNIQMFSETDASVSYPAPANGELIQVKSAGGPASDVSPSITVLSDNSTAVTGFFNESATFGQGEINQTVLTSTGGEDIFIARHNPDGTLAWAKSAGGIWWDRGTAITTLSDNSIVVTGTFFGTATFGKDEPNEKNLVSTGNIDLFIARYNVDGSLAWAKHAAGLAIVESWAITTLSDNSTVVIGTFANTATFGPGEPHEKTLNSPGDHDIFIAQYKPDGTLAWVVQAGGADHDEGLGITDLSDNSIVVTGNFNNSATFGIGDPNQTVISSDGLSDIFIACYNSSGILSWVKHAGGTGYDESGNGITALLDNSTVITGYFESSATFGSGESNQTILNPLGARDIFIARYNPNGTVEWAKQAGGSGYESGFGITTLSDNSTVVTGYFSDVTTFGSGEINETILNSAGSLDIFIARYNPDGTFDWAKSAGGAMADYGYEITTLSDDSTVVTGTYYDLATFGQGEPNQTVLKSEGDFDIFVARFAP